MDADCRLRQTSMRLPARVQSLMILSRSTFTTSSVATMMTGVYPSESHVFNSRAGFSAQGAEQSLPQLMRTGGVSTRWVPLKSVRVLSCRKPWERIRFLARADFQGGGLQHLWDVTTPLHQNSGIGSRIEEYFDLMEVWNHLGGLPDDLSIRFRRLRASNMHAKYSPNYRMVFSFGST